MKNSILTTSRQNTNGELSPWFNEQLEKFIEDGTFLTEQQISDAKDNIVEQLSEYRKDNNISTAVIGMSGGLDSALTAALFKEAGWEVKGYLMPIHQNPEETARGKQVCDALGIEGTVIQLDNAYQQMVKLMQAQSTKMLGKTTADKVRSGNIRARMRMITLYNMAHLNNGLVASTDNFSELSAGFWTLHGDVGDVSPIQSLYKSWEVPMMARMMGVPENVVTAKPTDGLGISGGGDEEQFGCSYLEWDIMLKTLLQVSTIDTDDVRANEVMEIVKKRIGSTAFKRNNPYFITIPQAPFRFDNLAKVEKTV